MFDGAVHFEIHPAIGIARVGNSPDSYFVGPQQPGNYQPAAGGFKDFGDPEKGIPPRVKRQAAEFRIYAYDAEHNILGEVTAADADIVWTVHLANKKAEWDRFAGTLGENLPLDTRRPRDEWRNSAVDDRDSLIIDAGERRVLNRGDSARFDTGTFRGRPVYLGEIRTDDSGRLLVLGGHGLSECSNPAGRIVNYANNDLWHDDTSDGPVTATVRIRGAMDPVTATPAWAIVAPPDFAPRIDCVVTLFDVAVDVAKRNPGELSLPASIGPSVPPSFTADVHPIFARIASLQWVQQVALERQTC